MLYVAPKAICSTMLHQTEVTAARCASQIRQSADGRLAALREFDAPQIPVELVSELRMPP